MLEMFCLWNCEYKFGGYEEFCDEDLFLFHFFQQQEQDPTNLYIANLPIFYSESELESMFKSYGTVISTRILRNQDGISRGVGFARMESKEKCEQIIAAFNGKIIPGKCSVNNIFNLKLIVYCGKKQCMLESFCKIFLGLCQDSLQGCKYFL